MLLVRSRSQNAFSLPDLKFVTTAFHETMLYKLYIFHVHLKSVFCILHSDLRGKQPYRGLRGLRACVSATRRRTVDLCGVYKCGQGGDGRVVKYAGGGQHHVQGIADELRYLNPHVPMQLLLIEISQQVAYDPNEQFGNIKFPALQNDRLRSYLGDFQIAQRYQRSLAA